MTPQQLVDRLQPSAAAPLVIDVRPRREFELCHLAGISQHVALVSYGDAYAYPAWCKSVLIQTLLPLKLPVMDAGFTYVCQGQLLPFRHSLTAVLANMYAIFCPKLKLNPACGCRICEFSL